MTRKRRQPMAKRLAKDEDGAVMILTVILMMLLVKACFSTFNVGVLTAERTRLQLTSDAAAYSSAVWQARFLNYCAYSRRAIIANYANVALFTAIESNKPLWDYYEEENPRTWPGCFSLTIRNDNYDLPIPTPRWAMIWFDALYTASHKVLADNDNARKQAESLSKMHSIGQQVLYYYVTQPWFTVVPEVVDASNEAVGGAQLPQIEISPAYKLWGTGAFVAGRSGMLNSSFVREADLKELQDDVEKRFDKFTKSSGTAFQGLPYFVSRPWWAFDPGSYWIHYKCPAITCIVPYDVSRTTFYWHGADSMDFSFSGKRSKTKDFLRPWHIGKYFLGFQIVWPAPCVSAPVYSIISDNETNEADYSHKYSGTGIKFYDLKANLDAEQYEPSVYVALRIQRDELVTADGSGGKLFNNIGIPLASEVRDLVAVSRAKVTFQPPWTDTLYEPNMYYPYWDAMLAPAFGRGFLETNNTLRMNSTALVTAVMLEAGEGPAAIATHLMGIQH